MGQQENNAYPPGTIVFAKLKGYPWWPAKVEDERTVPAKVMKQKTKTKSPIWTVFFFGSRDYGFFGPDSIRPFNKVNVEKDLKAKKFKTKDLEMAVREALDPTLMEEDEQEEEEEEEEQQQPQEKKKSKVTKGGKKANSTATNEVTGKTITPPAASKGNSALPSSTKKTRTLQTSDQEDMDTQQVVNNKRSVSEDAKSDKKKRRKSMSMEKEDQSVNGHDRASASPITPRKSEEGLNKDNESPEFTREFKRLYHLRHRLQKLMYEKKQGDIPLDDYPKISQALKDVEDAPMTYELLRHTKIGKVVKSGIGYDFGNDTEFSIHERCQQLLKRWKELFVDTNLARNQDTAGDHSNKDSTTPA
ncbi:uncharacterized protein BX664DRAFT_338602 [Halteromyces radiatus]|uniref:uncharacterized protein n=1 Tax=Halteromyces radiatus TaxID=101107 RepID=UPI0022207336|nr:uncharacterized protein BX664DRAFT_338602 [Halteromyces radiatus]KAI8085137.1 hypothetical protein BX664DRAFT_338602 [Halteromyces radiatus]